MGLHVTVSITRLNLSVFPLLPRHKSPLSYNFVIYHVLIFNYLNQNDNNITYFSKFNAIFFAHTVYLSASYDSQNKQRLFT